MEAGYGMTGPLMAGCGIKIFRWERDMLILTDWIPDSFEIDGGIRDETKNHTLQTIPGEPRPLLGRIGINILTGAGWRKSG